MSEHPSPPPPAEPPFVGGAGSLPLGIIAGAVAAVLCVGLWVLLYQALANLWIPPLLTGVGVGVATRLVGRTADRNAGIAAAVLALSANVVAFVVLVLTVFKWVDPTFVPTVGFALKRLVNDLPLVALFALSSYLAYLIGPRRVER